MTLMPWSVNELIDVYNATRSGHFFDPDTMRFFRSRVSGRFKRVSDRMAYFITTERGPVEGSKRRASIRRAEVTPQGKIAINTVGEFNRMTLQQAARELERMEREP
jgi:hypothetical protein